MLLHIRYKLSKEKHQIPSRQSKYGAESVYAH